MKYSGQSQSGASPRPTASSFLLLLLTVLVYAEFSWSAQPASLNTARRLIQSGSYTEAASVLRAIAQSHPDDADAHLLLGEVLALQDQRSASIDQFSEAIRLRPNDSLTYNLLGNALGRFGENEAAEKAFRTAIKFDPNLASARVNLGLILAQNNDLEGASRELDAAIRLEGNGADAATSHYLLGKIQLAQNRPDAAAAELEMAVKIQPQYAEAWYLLGTARRAGFEDATALKAFERAVAEDSANASYQYELGSEYLRQGKAHLAALHLNKALAGLPADRSVLYKLQRALREDNRPGEASQIEVRMRDLVAKADAAGTHAIAAQQLDDEGLSFEKQGKLAEALEKYSSAVELAPDEDGFRLNYALALCRLHHCHEGISEMQQILRHDAGNAAARRALLIAQDRVKSEADAQKEPAR